MKTVVFGFPDRDIHTVAATLARGLSIPLYQMHSPMIGVWYSSIARTTALAALTDGTDGSASTLHLSLEFNDPEPGYTGPAFPGDDTILLYVTAPETDLDLIEEQLRQVDLVARKRQG